ncbi:MAG: RNA polymerase sigma-70 factor [Chitinophagaceae bacterium]
MPSCNQEMFDEQAFEMLFKEHFKQLCAYCQYKFGFELDPAKDIVQTGFIRLWEIRHAISPDQSLKAYLYKVVTNIILDMLKHQKVKQKHEKYVLKIASKSSSLSDFENVDFKQLTADISKAVSELPEQMRNIFELCRYDGLKYAQVAFQLSISVKTVETQMSRALIKLREKLSDHLAFPCAILAFNAYFN